MFFGEQRRVFVEEFAERNNIPASSAQPPKELPTAELFCNNANRTLDKMSKIMGSKAEKVLTPERQVALQQHIEELYAKNWTKIKNPDLNKIKYIEPANFPPEFKKQFDSINDSRISKAVIIVIPKDMWGKGDQPSESHAEQGAILMREDYFLSGDKFAWTAHELGHLLKHEGAKETYEKDQEKPAFADISESIPYPNNVNELEAFTRQLQYLKSQGLQRDDAMKTLIEAEPDYAKHQRFFQRVMDRMNFGQ